MVKFLKIEHSKLKYLLGGLMGEGGGGYVFFFFTGDVLKAVETTVR